MQPAVSDLFRTYNEEMETAGFRRLPTLTADVRGQLEGFAEFCDRYGVDPVRWIRARLEATKARHRLKLTQLVSFKFLEAFKRFGDSRQAEEEGQRILGASVVTDDQAELSPAAEAVKRGLAADDDREVCMLSSRDITRGWDSRSRWCQSCRLAVPCQAALPEGVVRDRG